MGQEAKYLRREVGDYHSYQGAALALPLMAMLIGLVITPLLFLIRTAVSSGSDVSGLTALFTEKASLHILFITFSDSAIAATISVSLGAILAWTLRITTSSWCKRTIWLAMLLPFCMGTITKLYALTTLLNPDGVINTALVRLGLISQPLHLLYNQPSVIFGLVYQMVPFAMLPLYVAYETVPLDLVDAAQGLGASKMQVFRDVIFPLSTPSTVASWFIVYVLCTGFFLTPVLLGGLTAPFASSLISQAIFEYYNLGRAVATSLVLLACGIGVLSIGIALVGRERFERAIVS